MIKPFGKVVRSGWGLTRPMRLTIALWVAAIPAWILCGWSRSPYPTLAENPFRWPIFLVLLPFFAFSFAFWRRRRPSPGPPGESSRFWNLVWGLVAGVLIALPTAGGCAYLYEPAAKLANGLFAAGEPREEYAMVARQGADLVLDSPHWPPEFRWPVERHRPAPVDVAPGCLAKLRVRRGLLGATWVERIDYEVLR